MKIVVSANERMRDFTLQCVTSVEKLGYSVIVYDLGGLGFGKPFTVDNASFQTQGYYHEIVEGRYAPGEHKPAVVRDCLKTCDERIVYIDVDTLMIDRIDELDGDYDIGITVRPQWEVEKITKRALPEPYFIYDGFVNTGVMTFKSSANTYRFLEQWEKKISELHDEQAAINAMLTEFTPLNGGRIITRDGIRFKTFDTMIYNHYYFYTPENTRSYPVFKDDINIRWQDAKILHFKGKMRKEYPRILAEYQKRS